MLKQVQHDGFGVFPATSCPSPLMGRVGGGVLTPAQTRSLAALLLPQPLPAGKGGK